jgi:acyl carrier protein
MSRQEILDRIVQLITAAMPGCDPGALQEATDLYDLGLDSTTAVGLMLEIEDSFGLTFPDALITDTTFQTPGALSAAVETILAS